MDYKNLSTPQLVSSLQEVLIELRKRSIGLADIDGSMLPVIDHQKSSDRITMVKTTSLFACGTICIQRDSANKVIFFDEGKTIEEYTKAPIEFNKIVMKLKSEKVE